MLSTRVLSILNVVALMATLVVNALANILPINGLNTGQVSALYPSLFTPAGITFSIWSIIYLLLIIFAGMQLYLFHTRPYFRTVSGWFLLSCVLNATWILCWHYLFPGLAFIIMLALLATLIQIFRYLNTNPVTTLLEKAFVRLPFTIYLAWISVATIANAAAVLVAIPNINLLFPPYAWAIIMITVASLLALFITLKYQAPAFAAVVMWALFGIFLRWQKTEYSELATVAMVHLVILSSIYIYTSQKVVRQL